MSCCAKEDLYRDGKSGEKENRYLHISIFAFFSTFFFWLLQKKKKRDDEHAGFLFLIMQGTSLLCFLIFFRLYDTQVYQKERETADYIYLCLPSPKYSLCNSASFFFFVIAFPRFCCLFFFSLPQEAPVWTLIFAELQI